MTHIRRFVGLAVLSAILVPNVVAQNLKPGVKAPALKVEEWLKGNPVKGFEKGKHYVIEFWATWCVPCINAMPHLSKLAQEYKGKVEFVGVNVWERGDDIPKRVKEFVEKQGDKMAYNVARDDATGTMATTWLRAAGQNGIPSSFLVDGEGTILWIGHPMSLDKVLEKATAGQFDVEEAKAEFEKKAKRSAIMAEVMGGLQKATALAKEGKTDEATKLLNDLEPKAKDDDQLYGAVRAAKLQVGRKANPKAVDAEVDKLAANPKDHPILVSLLQQQFGPDGDKAFGLQLVRKLRAKAPIDADSGITWYMMGFGGEMFGEDGKATISDLENAKKAIALSKEFDEAMRKQVYEGIDKKIAEIKKKIGS